MKYALVLESNPQTCNDTANLVASLGYLVTPVFSPKKALHAAHMIQFDLIVTCTVAIPGDRRCLTGELARCSPDAVLILVAESEVGAVNRQFEGVNAVINRSVIPEELKGLADKSLKRSLKGPLPPQVVRERRRRAVD